MADSRWATAPSPPKATSPPPVSSGGSYPLDLTLGIEIEFILLHQHDPAQPVDEFDDHNADLSPDLGCEQIAAAFERPVMVTCRQCRVTHDYTLPLNHPRSGDQASVDWPQWIITEDGSVNVNRISAAFPNIIQRPLSKMVRHCSYWPIELKSRIMRPDQPIFTSQGTDGSHQHRINFEDEIRAVFDRANEFNSGKSSWRVLVNETCGLHVHVGNEKMSFPLQTAKNILSLYAANEKEIDSMQTSDRINGTAVVLNFDKQSCVDWDQRVLWPSQDHLNHPLSSHFALISHASRNATPLYKDWNFDWPFDPASFELPEALGKHDISSWQTVLDLAPDVKGLQNLQRSKNQSLGGHYSVVNLDNLLPYRPDDPWDEKGKVTIEFRQHAGTLNANAALAWVDFLVKLVRYAHSKTSDIVNTEIQAIWRDPKHTALHLLNHLGYDNTSEVFQHYKRVLGLRARNADSKERTYAASLHEREVKQEEKCQKAADQNQDLLHELVVWNSEQNYERSKREAVHSRIQEKFVQGCYGQFEENYLRHLPGPGHELSIDEMTKLTVGWTPPKVCKTSDLDDSLDDNDDDADSAQEETRENHEEINSDFSEDED